MEVLHEPPKTTSFTPLADHQSATPASFYTGPPVLHYHNDRSKLVILSSDLANCAPLSALTNAYTAASKQGATTNGHSTSSTAQPAPTDGAESTDIEIPDAEIWVTSSKFLIYSATASTGLAIPYPTISLHAIQSLPSETDDESQQGIYMQLNPSSTNPNETGDEEDEEEESVSLTIIPSPTITTTTSTSADPPSGELDTSDPSHPPPTQTTLLFNALSACSNLHPDPQTSSSENPDLASSSLFQAGLISAGDVSGGLPPAMPGSGGWITAENMHEYVDDEGNWIGGDEDEGLGEEEVEEGQAVPLGPGAGTVRARADEDGDGVDDAAVEEGTEETKWQRTA